MHNSSCLVLPGILTPKSSHKAVKKHWLQGKRAYVKAEFNTSSRDPHQQLLWTPDKWVRASSDNSKLQAGSVAWGLEFKPQYHQKQKQINKQTNKTIPSSSHRVTTSLPVFPMEFTDCDVLSLLWAHSALLSHRNHKHNKITHFQAPKFGMIEQYRQCCSLL
jgi:hypothetical protein